VPSLFVIRGSDQGARYELEDGLVGLGRESTNSIQVHDSEVSRRHAEIRRNGTSFVLSDLGSSNGTYVNNERVERHELSSGDQIQIGSTVMLFTGPSEHEEDLAENIDIVGTPQAGDSRIIRAMTQAESNATFALEPTGSESPWLARARSNLQVMYRTALAVSHTLDIDQLLSRIMDLIFEWVEASRGCIMLVDPDTKELVPKVRRTRKGIRREERITISRTILDYVREHNEGVLTSDAREDQRWDPARSILQTGVREAICVPMQGRYDVVGVIYIDTITEAEHVITGVAARKFNEEHLKLMIAIGHQAALAVEDTSYYSAMVQAERLAAVGQMIATLSHHIKNILQGISGGSYLIEEGLKASERDVIAKGWDIVQKNQQKISNLVMDMLTFSKEREPELVPADLNELVGDVVELMQGRARDLDVQLHWRPAADMPRLKFDPEGLHRAALNVITNAIDACDCVDNGRVDVSTEYSAQEGISRLVVEDNGRGIPADDIKKIFGLFVSRKGGRGTGLGLSVTQKIIKEHGGQVLVESEPDKGSRFVLELPALLVEEDARDTKDGETLSQSTPGAAGREQAAETP
jgi:two-component system, NtrC family, sensor kinase